MVFRRSEFDREAAFIAVEGVRGSDYAHGMNLLEWKYSFLII